MTSWFTPEKLSQNINPWTWFLNLKDNSSSWININYKTNHSDTEQKIISEVAGYGMQLDIIEHTILLMIDFIPKDKLSETQKKQISEFQSMMSKINEKKEELRLKRLSPEGLNSLIEDIKFVKENYPEKFPAIKNKINSIFAEK